MSSRDGTPAESNWTLRMPRLAVPEWIRRLPSTRTAIIFAVAATAAVAFCYGLLQTSLFTVQRVDVNGLSHLQKNEVIALSRVKVGQALISVNDGKAAHRIESNPWVKSAHVTDNWPHAVTITVVERKPVAQVQTADNHWAQVSSDGVILESANAPANGLPVILDVKPAVKAGGLLDPSTGPLLNVARLMPPSLQPHVLQMQNQNGTLRLGLDTGTIVILGDTSNMGDKLMAAAAVVSQTDAKKLATLDVTSPHLPIGTPVGGTSTTPSSSLSKASPATTSTTVASKSRSTTTTTASKHTQNTTSKG